MKQNVFAVQVWDYIERKIFGYRIVVSKKLLKCPIFIKKYVLNKNDERNLKNASWTFQPA